MPLHMDKEFLRALAVMAGNHAMKFLYDEGYLYGDDANEQRQFFLEALGKRIHFLRTGEEEEKEMSDQEEGLSLQQVLVALLEGIKVSITALKGVTKDEEHEVMFGAIAGFANVLIELLNNLGEE